MNRLWIVICAGSLRSIKGLCAATAVTCCTAIAAAVGLAGVGHAADPVKPAAPLADPEKAADRSSGATPGHENPRGLDFAPPPVPDFMLRKPEQPLTLEQMRRQADEAAEKSRRGRVQQDESSPK